MIGRHMGCSVGSLYPSTDIHTIHYFPNWCRQLLHKIIAPFIMWNQYRMLHLLHLVEREVSGSRSGHTTKYFKLVL